MPTDLGAVSARKRHTRAQTQTGITMVFVWFIPVSSCLCCCSLTEALQKQQ